MKKCYVLTLTSCLLLLAACSDDVDVSVNFTQTQLLKSGDPVKFNGETIGEVADVDELDQGTEVELELDPEKISGLNSSSVALVIDEPERHLQIYSNMTGEPIEPGATIEGLNNPIDLATWTAGNALGSLQGLATAAASAFNEFLNDNNWDDVAEQLNETLSGLGEESADALNQMGGELEEFIKNMQEQSSESLKQADELSKQLNDELRKFQEQGGAEDIAKALKNMLDAFNAALDPNALGDLSEKGEPL